MAKEGKIKTDQAVNRSKKDWKRMLQSQWVVANIPFFLFLSGLAVIYIYNGHHADKLIREIGKSEKNIRELEYEYKTLKSEVIFRSKASQLSLVVEKSLLFEPKQPPVVIEIPDTKEK